MLWRVAPSISSYVLAATFRKIFESDHAGREKQTVMVRAGKKYPPSENTADTICGIARRAALSLFMAVCESAGGCGVIRLEMAEG